MKSKTHFAIIICIVLFVLQLAFLPVPLQWLTLFTWGVRPLVLVIVLMLIFFVLGWDRRQVRGAYHSNMVAVIAVILYAITFIITTYLFGGGFNPQSSTDPVVIFRHVWTFVVPLCLGELIRYKLIKAVSKQDRVIVIVPLTLVLALAQVIGVVRIFFHGGRLDITEFVLGSLLLAVILSVVASYIAIDGSFPAIMAIMGVYSMAPIFMPFVPSVQIITWSLIVSFLLFLVIGIYYFTANEERLAKRRREDKAAKYEKKSPMGYVVLVVVVIIVAAFFTRALPFYPIVIRTGSMAGTFERGSVVFVERVPQGTAFDRVGEGYAIHFARGSVEIVHRTIAFRYNVYGNREFITQGDANETADHVPVQLDDVLGIARATIPYIGFPFLFFDALRGL